MLCCRVCGHYSHKLQVVQLPRSVTVDMCQQLLHVLRCYRVPQGLKGMQTLVGIRSSVDENMAPLTFRPRTLKHGIAHD